MIGYKEFIRAISESTMIMLRGAPCLPGFVVVDLHYHKYLVNVEMAEKYRKDLVGWMENYSWDKGCFVNRGWKFFERGLVDRDTTLRFFAMGAAIGLWNVITPEFFGLSGGEADKAADNGYIAINVYEPAGEPGVLSGIAKRNEKVRREKDGEFVLTNTGFSYGDCFVSPRSGICKEQIASMPALYCWAYSEESAKRIVDMVGRGAKYIYFPSDPKRTHTVLITACREDDNKLKYLREMINCCGYINSEMLDASRTCTL